MSLQKFCEVLDTVEKTSSRKEKINILKEVSKDKELNSFALDFFSIAMDWFRIYNIGSKTLKSFEGSSDQDIWGTVSNNKPQNALPATWEGFCQMIREIEGGQRWKADKVNNQLSAYPDSIRKWLIRAVLKNLRIGVSESTINKIWPNLINYFEVQLAEACKDLKEVKYPVSIEPKLDGLRCICIKEDRKYRFFTRGGQNAYNCEKIASFMSNVNAPNGVYDGELFTDNFNETQSLVTTENPEDVDQAILNKLKFYVFDYLTLEEWNSKKCLKTYEIRRKAIPFKVMAENVAKSETVVITKSHIVNNEQEIKEINKHYLNMNYEGVMIKKLDGLYEFDRSKDWLKFKPVETDDFLCVGFEIGEKDNKYRGKVKALIVKLSNGEECKVGSGLNDEQRVTFLTSPPIDQYIEVEYKMYTPDGSLREPVFKRVRFDKKVMK